MRMKQGSPPSFETIESSVSRIIFKNRDDLNTWIASSLEASRISGSSLKLNAVWRDEGKEPPRQGHYKRNVRVGSEVANFLVVFSGGDIERKGSAGR